MAGQTATAAAESSLQLAELASNTREVLAGWRAQTLRLSSCYFIKVSIFPTCSSSSGNLFDEQHSRGKREQAAL